MEKVEFIKQARLAKAERETIISYNRENDEVEIYTTDITIIQRLLKDDAFSWKDTQQFGCLFTASKKVVLKTVVR